MTNNLISLIINNISYNNTNNKLVKVMLIKPPDSKLLPMPPSSWLKK